jgi:formamidopyrimidine-DNA glycosylase
VPELPEVETTRRGIAPYVAGQTIIRVIVRERRLRWPVSSELETALAGTVIRTVERRAKYLLLYTDAGCVLVHLGMSGSLCILSRLTPAQQHDHVDVELASGHCLRFTDPRRFGAWLWTTGAPEQHPLLCHLGPEPLEEGFTAGYLHALARGRRMPVKAFVMDSRVVAGVGNIYANEALFLAGINPLRAAGRIAFLRYEGLVKTIRDVLTAAILQGGTTLRDFVGGEGKAGYFQQYLRVYGREGCPCLVCGAPIRMRRLGQRSTFYCPRCQR